MDFIKSLTIDQLESIKSIIDNELSSKKAKSREHNVEEYKTYSEKELKSIRRKYSKQQNLVKNNKEYDFLQFHIDCMDEALAGFKTCQ